MTAKGSYSSASDVWSLGVCLWEIQSLGQLPYGELSADEVHERIASAGLRLTPPDECPTPLANLMSRCWMLETAVRPTFADVEGELTQLRANLRKKTPGAATGAGVGTREQDVSTARSPQPDAGMAMHFALLFWLLPVLFRA